MKSSEPLECYGVLFPRDPKIITRKVARRLRGQSYETPEVEGVSKFVRPEDRVLELGSGIGFLSAFLGKVIGATEITCVEANEELCAYARSVHALNCLTHIDTINGIACSDRDVSTGSASAPFFITEPFWSSSLTRPRTGQYREVETPKLALSALLNEKKPNVLIADIEGAEATLFDDVDLAGVQSVFMELHTRIYGGSGIRLVFEHMHSQGFVYHQRVSCGGTVLFRRV